MSDVMLRGVLRMPYEMAMRDELSRRQFYERAQEALKMAESAETAERERVLEILEGLMPSEERSVNWSQEDHARFLLVTQLERQIREDE